VTPLAALLPALVLAVTTAPEGAAAATVGAAAEVGAQRPAVAPAATAPSPSPSLPPPPTAAARPLRVVVGDFVLAGAAHPELARVLSDAAARGVQGTPGLTVLGQGEISAILGLDRTRQMMGCSEEQGCVSELGRALDADRLVSGSLTLLERTALLTVRFIDVRQNHTLARTTGTLLDATEAELVDAARRLAHEAVTGTKLDTTGTIRIAVSRTGADVTLDGRSLGVSPVGGAQRVLEGPHTVTVQKAGYVRWSTTVAVKAGQDLAVDSELVPLALLGEASRSRLWSWGWTSAGVAVAAGGAAVVFGKMADKSYAAYQAATERSAAVDLHNQVQLRTTMANVSWGVSAVAALSAVGLLTTAMVQDARAARDLEPGLVPTPPAPAPARGGKATADFTPLPGGGAVTLSLAF
jgi:hypothetical protein